MRMIKKNAKAVIFKYYTCIQVIQEAQEMAVRDHNVEYKSNLWIGVYFLKHFLYLFIVL